MRLPDYPLPENEAEEIAYLCHLRGESMDETEIRQDCVRLFPDAVKRGQERARADQVKNDEQLRRFARWTQENKK